MSMLIINNPEPYSDYVSLKKYVEGQYGTAKINMFHPFRAQTGTAGAVDLSEKGGQTIAQIGKTETNLQVISSAGDAGLEHAVITAHYKDADGSAHTATIADAVADMSGATDFDTPVTDFYCWDVETYGTAAFSSSLAVGVGKTLSAGVAGTGYAQIAAAGTEGTAAAFIGVGSVYCRTESNHNDGDGIIETLNWCTPWGDIKEGATGTINTTDGTTEVLFQYLGFPIQDYYRTRSLLLNQAGTANTHSVQLCNSNNSAIYAIVEELLYESIHTRYMVPASTVARAWLARIRGTNGTAAVSLAITLTPKGKHAITTTKTIPYPYMFDLPLPIPIELEPLSEITFTILGNTAVFETEIVIIEAEV